MPAPMPPQGGPPAQGAPSPDGQGPSGGQVSAIQNLMENVEQGLQHLQSFLGQAQGVPPEIKQAIGQINQMYGGIMQALGGEPDEDDQGSGAPGQPVPQAAAGNPNAIPHQGQG